MFVYVKRESRRIGNLWGKSDRLFSDLRTISSPFPVKVLNSSVFVSIKQSIKRHFPS